MAVRISFGLVAALALGACAAAPEPAPETPVAPRAAVPPPAPPIAWAAAPDCQGKLALLDEAARAGRLAPDERPPIAVVLPDASGGLDWLAPPSVNVTADLPLEVHERRDAARLTAPCLLLIEPARDQRVGHRLVGRDLVRSLYQNALRSERNPDYDAAQLRVRQAERDAKNDGPDILKVGDPMLDIFGLLIGGVLSGFSQGSRERELDAALGELAATPRSHDRPLYRPYEFEQTTVVAGKEATVPVTLLDRASGRLWRAELRQRERREIAIIEGLDPRDRDYEKHSAASMTRHDFERWQRDPPQLQLSAIVAALRETASAPERDTEAVVALATQLEPDAAPSHREQLQPLELEPLDASSPRPPSDRAGTGRGDRAAAEDSRLLDRRGEIADDALAVLIDERAAAQDDAGLPRDLDAALTLWPEDDAPRPAARAIAPAIAPAGDPRGAGVVRLAAGTRSGSGIYVRPDLVLTTAQMVDGASVVDVLTADGAPVLGLVARADPARDLALVQVARPGRPVMLHDGPPLSSGQPLEALALGPDTRTNLLQGRYEGGSAPGIAGPGFIGLVSIEAPAAPADALAMPWFAGDALIGLAAGAPFENPEGSLRVVGSSAIRDFLYGSGSALAVLP